jgi:hypothetical protein
VIKLANLNDQEILYEGITKLSFDKNAFGLTAATTIGALAMKYGPKLWNFTKNYGKSLWNFGAPVAAGAATTYFGGKSMASDVLKENLPEISKTLAKEISDSSLGKTIKTSVGGLTGLIGGGMIGKELFDSPFSGMALGGFTGAGIGMSV